MAVAWPVGFDPERLRSSVNAIYSRLAAEPEGGLRFHRDPEYAAMRLGYQPAALAALPAASTRAFGPGDLRRSLVA